MATKKKEDGGAGGVEARVYCPFPAPDHKVPCGAWCGMYIRAGREPSSYDGCAAKHIAWGARQLGFYVRGLRGSQGAAPAESNVEDVPF